MLLYATAGLSRKHGHDDNDNGSDSPNIILQLLEVRLNQLTPNFPHLTTRLLLEMNHWHSMSQNISVRWQDWVPGDWVSLYPFINTLYNLAIYENKWFRWLHNIISVASLSSSALWRMIMELESIFFLYFCLEHSFWMKETFINQKLASWDIFLDLKFLRRTPYTRRQKITMCH